MRVAGADVWKGKWIVVVLRDGRFERAFVAPDIVAAVAEPDDCVAIGVDMPVGLPPADVEARAFVGPRRSSVFPTPSAELLACASAAEANALAKERGWPGISAQAFALKKQILAVQPLRQRDTADRQRLLMHTRVSTFGSGDSPGPVAAPSMMPSHLKSVRSKLNRNGGIASHESGPILRQTCFCVH